MIEIRKSTDRGHAKHGWLDSYHTFSFADYYDPKFMGFRSLRVINEDRIAAGQGFPMHPHRDMEILTYIIEGELQHQDTMGNTEIIRPGEVQRMSAGTGVRHSEANPSEKNSTHLLQIWIEPDEAGVKPGYEQKSHMARLEKNWKVLAASRTGREGSVKIHQDADLYVARLALGENQQIEFGKGRYGWIQVVKGELEVSGLKLSAGDAAAIVAEKNVSLSGKSNCEILVFDLP